MRASTGTSQSASGEGALARLACTVEGAALIGGVGRDLLYDEIRSGRLRSRKAGSRRIIARHHLIEWLDGDRQPDPRARKASTGASATE